MSNTGKCGPCGLAVLADNVHQLVEHSGPRFDHWRQSCLAAFGVRSPDA